ncbi:MAG: dicarboxylate/amino acid:cation symporter [Tyzzerella sp.]|uniref:Dicarboxylate/amino acid:cation symporter n=1 Tax=Candidatus Fimicola merdigallinarum TaxID=2840819 RepID=A0A9D9H4Q1_9FIRM|nr:dicarboxylate/amino acid:cation symporter [Candidatus Fimicola merdigallinarum]
MSKKKLSLATYIFIGLLIGIVLGFLMKQLPSGTFRDTILVGGIIKFIGNGFINLIKMIVVPLVFCSLSYAVCDMSDFKKLGRISFKTITFYLATTALAVTIATILGLVLKPGAGLDLSQLIQGDYDISNSKPIVDMLLEILPTNPIKAMAEGNLLQIIVFALFFGVSVALIGEKGKILVNILDALNECVLKIVTMVMYVAPIGVCALIANTVYSVGLESLVSVAKMIGVVAIGMLIHSFVVYSGLLKVFTGLPVRKFLKEYSTVATVTFTTSSSNASLPVSMEAMEKLGVDKSVYSFTLPLGATINMDGTAIMQGVAAVFIAQVYGMDMSIQMILSVILTAVLASIGTAGAPGVGMITLAMVLESAGLPVDGIALIIGFDRILDMMRTTVNVMGDCVCSVIVADSEKELDREKYINC